MPTPPAGWEGEFVTARQAAQFLSVHVRTVQRYARTGKLRSYSIPGDGYRFKRVDVEAFLAPNHDLTPLDPEEGIS